MNEKEEKMLASVMTKVLNFEISTYHTVFLTELAMRRYNVANKKKKEKLEESTTKTMKKMPDLCKKTEGLKDKKNVVETSAERSLEALESEPEGSQKISDKLLRGNIVENVLNYLLEDYNF